MDIHKEIYNIMLITYTLINVLSRANCLQTTTQAFSSTWDKANGTTLSNEIPTIVPTDTVTSQIELSRPQDEYDYMIVEHGEPCARIAFMGYLQVHYHAANHLVKDYSSSIPSHALFTGQCGDNTTTIQLSWQPANFSLTFQFQKKSQTWVIHTVQTQFDLSAEVFDRSTGSGVQEVRSEPDMEYMETPLGKAYTCSGEESLDLRPYNGSEVKETAVHSVKLAMRQLSFQPFQLEQDGVFSKGYSCSMDERNKKSATVVPTVVAVLLSVIVLMILVSYSVYNKYNSRTPYVPMD